MANLSIALVGNPNCGKTTLFNALTGSRQRVGNWPGVTVERKSGFFIEGNKTIEVIDLPGIYSLAVASESSIDERIASDFILNQQVDVIVNILDASNLERHLYLTLQLIEMRIPVILAVNMMDMARKKNKHILLDKLKSLLDCPVIPLEADKGKGIQALKKLVAHSPININQKELSYLPEIQAVINELAFRLKDNHSNLNPAWLAVRLLEEDTFVLHKFNSSKIQEITAFKQHVASSLSEDADILLAESRYIEINKITQASVGSETSSKIRDWSSKIDNFVLNRFLGLPFFLFTMYALFLFSINIGGAFQDFFDIASNTIFVDGLAYLLNQWGMPHGLILLLANGIGKGISTTLTFIPVIGAMFFALAFLEDSGYMARAAFIVDRLMRALGLPGKSFVPMIVGFGCNVPAVMAARTLENQRDRILTVMMSPFMSCGARLAIFAVFTAAFFPVGGQNIVFLLYLIGIVMAVLTGLALRKTVLQGEPAPLIMELPPYHFPKMKTLMLLAWHRLKSFVFRAGKLIVPICALIGVLNALNIDGPINGSDGNLHSWLSYFGAWLTPLFAPMGIHENNWPATVGLLTGILAKEVVVGTLNTLYSQFSALGNMPSEVFHFWGGLQEAVLSIPANLSQLGNSLGNPVLAKAPIHTLNQSAYGEMFQRFDGQVGAMAYLLFVLLYLPCVSTTAAIMRELNKGWALFSVLWTTMIAYGAAVIFYQTATLMQHPIQSISWIAVISVSFGMTLWIMRSQSKRIGGSYGFARN